MTVELHVNVDHVATVRNARGSRYPDPVHAAVYCERAGAHGITVHLREDRRHIRDRDVEVLRETVSGRLNLEMAATDEMLAIALRVKPDLVTLVPEKREERTTEGGLDVAGQLKALTAYVGKLREGGIPTSLFIDPDAAQVKASAAAGAAAIELHTGDYANAPDLATRRKELERLAAAADLSSAEHPELVVAAGHGLTERNVVDLVRLVTPLEELNIGHALVADAVISGLEEAVLRFRAAIDDGESRR
ncbi:MAG TPA: pyridoxine 5'-phosphate synthase [Polyangiaceae bacterium LLY-WYZ-15_(1-7)]|nr:pyridoxine 5'-phosphate synthase [Myxococcales bacterium]MAT26586.1 pyridoxine 5'-phosphate synthase [Sandaracinus sp.]HJL02529.1 pyridoxine 5'-phosphate synthase [Polyangiaceae bacterium LLY-WYZ-15_(1-7)]HJL11740.1 pyridoxine 5'-phosphate synthase [Polyangiaceae bacterium LLY-WYZ-15_(1-7)]